ncbi:MAG: hypothetical protein BGO05_05330 [Rhizobiales bacterium 63-7]|nr:hypothetical protein [Hyphomicrobiales bacterium]OJU66626.1 MAG: hypothetical protein BGO05_05330 [Rhizobiales bacterium 63-7]
MCEANKLCDRLEKQIKNIEGGGSISPEVVAQLMREARERLSTAVRANVVSAALLRGEVAFDVVVVGGGLGSHEEPGGLH